MAQTVLDQGLGGSRDQDLAAVCRREDRIIITFDTGFADIRQYPPSAYPGIVVLRLDSQARHHTLAIGTRATPRIGRQVAGRTVVDRGGDSRPHEGVTCAQVDFDFHGELALGFVGFADAMGE